MRKLILIGGGVFALCVAFGLWWDMGQGQAWWATFTGTDNGCFSVPAPYKAVCEHYGFWSGFGSVIPWAFFSMTGIFAGLIVGLRHVNCHEKGCWRVGKFALAGGEYKVCGKHHLGFEGKHPSLEHMWARHLQFKGKDTNHGTGTTS